MLKYILKSTSLLMMVTSSNLIADELSIDKHVTPTVSKICPADFHTLPLYPNAKFCQLFDTKLPASLSYFAVSGQQATKDFYLQELGEAEDEKMLKGRIVLQYEHGEKVVIISKDGTGSQVDILVKSSI
ncbi:hypothetical protein [Paraglaciecola marina]|uniref:hypothetical protein n=1 Tax=Paraglaciecola marina TaxID=2500157 RepID=UPI001EF0A584|nr:hypothetical protein [Paraglaciecola marina]